MNTKYTLEITVGQTDNFYSNFPLRPKSIRKAKKRLNLMNPQHAVIKNKRGEPIHEYTEGEGWKRVNVSKRNHCMLITVGYNWKTRKPITVPYSQC